MAFGERCPHLDSDLSTHRMSQNVDNSNKFGLGFNTKVSIKAGTDPCLCCAIEMHVPVHKHLIHVGVEGVCFVF